MKQRGIDKGFITLFFVYSSKCVLEKIENTSHANKSVVASASGFWSCSVSMGRTNCFTVSSFQSSLAAATQAPPGLPTAPSCRLTLKLASALPQREACST